MSVYEQDALLAQYLDLHYGEAAEILPWPNGPRDALEYPVRCVNELFDPSRLPGDARALEVGCAVGRSSFELRAYCPQVIGLDLSNRFIECARCMQRTGHYDFHRYEEGELVTPVTYRVPESLARDGVRFDVGDACQLRGDLGSFDVVFNVNLIDRLPRPRLFLDRLPGMVRQGGQLILGSPFTWMEPFTPREEWLGGRVGEGRTWDRLCDLLSATFDLEVSADLPFIIREHARKFQWSVARVGRWRRRR